MLYGFLCHMQWRLHLVCILVCSGCNRCTITIMPAENGRAWGGCAWRGEGGWHASTQQAQAQPVIPGPTKPYHTMPIYTYVWNMNL